MKNNEKQKYTEEFKQDAVNLLMKGRRAVEVARDLNISPSCLNRWRREYLSRLDLAHDGVGKSPSEMAAEIKHLRKELAESLEINVILKKTIKYFS